MMMMMGRVMCVLAVVLCFACGYTMAAAAAVDDDSPSGRGVSRGAVEVSCGAGGALRVRPAAESEWLTCGARSHVSACGKYADLCRQRTARAARTTTTNVNARQPKAVMAIESGYGLGVFSTVSGYHPAVDDHDIIKNLSSQPSSTTPVLTPRGLSGDSAPLGLGGQTEHKESEAKKDIVPDAVQENLDRVSESQDLKDQDHLKNTKELSQRPSIPQVGITENSGAMTTLDGHSPTHGQTSDETSSQLPEVGTHVASTSSVAQSPSVSNAAGGNSSSDSRTQNAVEGTEAQEGSLQETAKGSPTTAIYSDEGVDSNQHTSPTLSENTPTNSSETSSTTPPRPENTVSEAPTTTPSPAPVNVTAAESQENNSTTQPSSENTTTEAPAATPSPVPNAEINNTLTEAPTTTPSPSLVPNADINTIASTVQKKANADSSVSPVWVRVPLLIVALLFSVTVY
ncbi:uncharacterized protein TM35_000151810 [Trypanosoma theileri]|uniref:Mucin-associated surface protein (MASP) n=1 Tax=Trypanosoma theileri TaxID=67003 RepID=A0A1X0NXA1_9TRYP|nr:uncharacterized protein TM35_000151810 [Trypanosoma theileri]ORC88750.1 hypothetical protein TM35_000151810 [Trypanosoma theileri]